eukprot:g32831.t1
MLQASEAPEALVAQLLALLAEAAEAADRCGGAMAEEKNPAEEDVGWVVNLVLATLAEKHEADTLASKRLSEALRTALDNHSKASEACKGKPATPQHHGTASKAAPFAGGGRPDIGGDVWACWPVDGHWYRAKVLGFAPRDRVKVAWCAPLKEDSHDCVEISDLDAELFSELSSSSLIRVDASIRRPPPAELTQVPAENCWTQALRKVESHSRNFQELRRVGKQLDFHIDWGTCGEDATTEETSMWRYESEGQSEELSQEKPMLCGAAETISAWRVEIEERAEALGSFAADCEKEVKTFEDQISSSTAAMSAELETLHSERALTARRADGLRMRREELLAQLHAVEERAKQH